MIVKQEGYPFLFALSQSLSIFIYIPAHTPTCHHVLVFNLLFFYSFASFLLFAFNTDYIYIMALLSFLLQSSSLHLRKRALSGDECDDGENSEVSEGFENVETCPVEVQDIFDGCKRCQECNDRNRSHGGT